MGLLFVGKVENLKKSWNLKFVHAGGVLLYVVWWTQNNWWFHST